MLARKFVLANKIVGAPKLTDFKLEEETISSELQDGGMNMDNNLHTNRVN